jgi:hypothetical protein
MTLNVKERQTVDEVLLDAIALYIDGQVEISFDRMQKAADLINSGEYPAQDTLVRFLRAIAF